MRMSILNTATTEQMGYIMFSFFVYTKSAKQEFFILLVKFHTNNNHISIYPHEKKHYYQNVSYANSVFLSSFYENYL